jgi:16S rRNA (guanine(966)-N(2))-methyltransferase RsmD
MLTADGVFADEAEGGSAPRVLDLYAGSGALGLEALSRGAREVVFVESARPAIAAIRENVRSLDVTHQVTTLAMRVERALTTLLEAGHPFDLIVIDPPYAEVRDARFSDLFEKSARLLTTSGILTLEHASADTPEVPAGLALDRQRKHGDTTLSLYRPRFRILGASSS